MKKYLYLFAATAFMAGCSNEDFVGEVPANVPTGKSGAIEFAGVKPNTVRAAGSEAAAKLNKQFNVYGTKTTDKLENVFAKSQATTITDGQTYAMLFDDTKTGHTTTNVKGWEYVLTDGTGLYNGGAIAGNQTIKYWDYDASQYEFVAYSATPGSEGKGATITNITDDGFHVKGTAKQFANLFIANKLITKKADYDKTVTFTFRSAATKVRLGIYETINGYDVKEVTFRYNGDTEQSDAAAWLDGQFIGDTGSEFEADVTFDATKDYLPVVSAIDGNYTRTKMFNFGSFTKDALGTTANTPTWAGGDANYAYVLPNTVHVGPMTLYVDYTLVNNISGETIRVTGAKAVVHESHMKWEPNYAYTYLFKISDNTNGTTGEEGVDPAGLFPITFDAVTIDAQDATIGTVTTVSEPSITTYANGTVSDAGITYATTKTPIYVTITDMNGNAVNMANNVCNLYTVPAGTTEADCQLGTVILGTSVAGTSLSVGTTEDITVPGTTIALTKNNYATLSNLSNATYAFECNIGGKKCYKIIVVE